MPMKSFEAPGPGRAKVTGALHPLYWASVEQTVALLILKAHNPGLFSGAIGFEY